MGLFKKLFFVSCVNASAGCFKTAVSFCKTMAIYLKKSNHLIMPSSQFLISCLEGLLHIDFYGKFFFDHYHCNLVCHGKLFTSFYKVIDLSLSRDLPYK
uniref:Putative ovule protein n=1 Tax=Solanum chacoense TaxID=4108 RepID=A0A0V0HYG3_SOLCH